MRAVSICLCLVLCFWCVPSASAADVSIDVSSRETYVGQPVTLRIAVVDTSGGGRGNRTPPVIADVDGLVIESMGPPMVNSQVSFNNGRRSARTSLVYRYQVTPQRTGSFVIPPIRVDAGGVKTITEAVRLAVTKSETGDLMFVEVTGKRQSVYVGEPIELTLKIWVRPFKDPQRDISLSESQMWQMFSKTTNWGKFQTTITEAAKNNQRPAGRRVLREDGEGTPREYLLYEIAATVYPTAPGEIDADDVRIAIDYPTEIGRRNDSFSSLLEDSGLPFGGRGTPFDDDFFRGFGSRLTVTAVRPIVGEASVEPIEVKPIPDENRPDSYLGAIGRYQISVAAAPTDVRVGDPITLEISINGDGPLDLIRAPKLSGQPDLTTDFKVADDDLAGFVDGRRKVFQTTLRPRREDVTQIPAIELSYFDPATGQFVTTRSDPISVNVEAGDILAMDSIVASRPATSRPMADADLDDVSQSSSWLQRLLAPPPKATTLFPPNQVLQPKSRYRLFSGALVCSAIMGPPVLFFASLLFASRGRLTSPRRRLERSIQQAETADQVASSLRTYLMQKTGVVHSCDQAIGVLRRGGDGDLAIRSERFFVTSQKSPSGRNLDELKAEAREIASRVAKTSTRPDRHLSVAKATAIGILFCIASPMHAAESTLSPPQQGVLAEEASRLYGEQKFAESAEKFRTLVRSGVQNDRLFFNLASAEDRAGRHAHAVAFHRKALRIDPTNGVYYDQMKLAESDAIPSPSWQVVNDRVLSIIRPRTMATIATMTWIAFWIVLAAGVFNRLPGRRFITTTAITLLTVSTLAGASFFARTLPLSRDDTAVLVTGEVILRDGDGDEFSVANELSGVEGRVVTILDQRSGWTHLQMKDGTSGWVTNETIIVI